jgi:hypothetical protein
MNDALVCATGPPKSKRAPAKSALRNAELLAAYHLAASHAKLFERPFWFFEQRRVRLMDQLENEKPVAMSNAPAHQPPASGTPPKDSVAVSEPTTFAGRTGTTET